ncbi:MAG: hypothetical protein ACJ74Y_14085 [Bryobacteraceae bacterium]|jgi:hypothetical protein
MEPPIHPLEKQLLMKSDHVCTELGLPSRTPEELCHVCEAPVKVMIFRGTGYCSQLCYKAATDPQNMENPDA